MFSKAELQEADWNFSQVPAEELEACFHYECMRESPRLRKTAEVIQEKSTDQQGLWERNLIADYEGLGVVAEATSNFAFQRNRGLWRSILLMPEFPGTPWMSVESKRRKEVVKFLENQIRLSVPDDKERINDHSLTLLLRAPWGATIPQLKKAFSTQLASLEKNRPELFQKAGGRGNFGDKLRQLSSKRLLRWVSPQRAAHMTRAVLKHPLFGDAVQFRESCKAAEAFLSDLLPREN